MKFYEEHAEERDKFEIIAFHDASAESVADIDRKLKEGDVIKKNWGGKNLPFPVLIDATESTTDGWGVSGFPTIVVIGPDGLLTKVRSLRGFEKVLAASTGE